MSDFEGPLVHVFPDGSVKVVEYENCSPELQKILDRIDDADPDSVTTT